MGNTLHELANKLQQSIIKQQENAHDSMNLNTSKYNNLKLKISSSLTFPHVIVCIGISEATFDIKDGTKTDGGLGPDEKYVKKWLGSSGVLQNLKELYTRLTELVSAEEESGVGLKTRFQEGEAEEIKRTAPNSKAKRGKRELMTAEEMLRNGFEEDITIDSDMEVLSEDSSSLRKAGYLESVEEIKQDLKAYFRSSFKKDK